MKSCLTSKKKTKILGRREGEPAETVRKKKKIPEINWGEISNLGQGV